MDVGASTGMQRPDGVEAGKVSEARIRARNETRILGSAVQLFAAKGFDGTRLSEIADHCGLPRANLYYYFSSKDRIYTALIEQVINGWDRAFEHIRPDREPRAAIAAYVEAKLEYSRTHPVESRFFASEILRGAGFLTRRHRQHMRDVTDRKAGVVREWVRQGRLSPVDPYHFFIVLWSATQFYADYGYLAAGIIHRKQLTRRDFATAAETISGLVLDGCSRDPIPGPAGLDNPDTG